MNIFLRVWDASTGQPISKLEGRTDFVTSVAVTGDGSRIISGSHDNTVRVWDATTGQPISKLEGHTDPVDNVAEVSNDFPSLFSIVLCGNRSQFSAKGVMGSLGTLEAGDTSGLRYLFGK